MLREVLGLNQREFASFLGITPSALNQIEHHKRNPSLKTLLKIRSEFHFSIDELLKEVYHGGDNAKSKGKPSC